MKPALSAALLALLATPALAQTAPAAKTGATAAAQTKPARPMASPARPGPKPMAMSATAHPMKPAATKPMAATGRMVSTTTSTGKKITYDCAKPGNATKKVCKG